VNKLDLPLADELATLAARMSPMMLSAETVNGALQVLTLLAQETIAGATGAGVSLMTDAGRRTSTAATSDVVMEADNLQYQLDEGPCLSARDERRTVRIDDIDLDDRWPRWSEAVRPLHLHSALSTPLFNGDHVLGAVKVYSELPDAFDERSGRLLHGFAETAAVLLGNMATRDEVSDLSGDLKQALRARDSVQLAKGILMQRDHLSEEQALDWIVEAARASDRSLRGVAEEIISSSNGPAH
jgi:GAF domain-containing protein